MWSLGLRRRGRRFKEGFWVGMEFGTVGSGLAFRMGGRGRWDGIRDDDWTQGFSFVSFSSFFSSLFVSSFFLSSFPPSFLLIVTFSPHFSVLSSFRPTHMSPFLKGLQELHFLTSYASFSFLLPLISFSFSFFFPSLVQNTSYRSVLPRF